MYGTGGHYVKGNQPRKESQTSCFLTNWLELKIKTIELMELESRMMVTRVWEGCRWIEESEVG